MDRKCEWTLECNILLLNASSVLLQLSYNSAMTMTTSATTEEPVTHLNYRQGEHRANAQATTLAPSVKVRYQNNTDQVKSNIILTLIVPTATIVLFRLLPVYNDRHAHKCLYTVLPLYSKIQVLPGITSCRLMKTIN